jgi:hypothetical protein
MTPVVEKLLAEVQAPPNRERDEVLAALLQRAKTEPHDLPDDADLVAADALFQELDRREEPR